MVGRSGSLAWAVLGIGVIVYEVCAPEGQLLSEVVDGALLRHPVLTRLGVVLLALHLLNGLPNKLDPVHQAVSLRMVLRRALRAPVSVLEANPVTEYWPDAYRPAPAA